MRHALLLVLAQTLTLALTLALGLAACTPDAKAPDQPSPVGLDAGAIEVTPLESPPGDAGASAALQAPAATEGVAEPRAAAAASAAAAAAPSAAPSADAVTVTAATASTPHPRPRPAGLGQGTAAAEPAPPPKSQPQLTCEAAGGIWGQSRGKGAFLCQKRMKDGGKVCHKKGDCTGECLGPSQTCAPVAPLMGCNDVMDAEGRQVTLCLD